MKLFFLCVAVCVCIIGTAGFGYSAYRHHNSGQREITEHFNNALLSKDAQSVHKELQLMQQSILDHQGIRSDEVLQYAQLSRYIDQAAEGAKFSAGSPENMAATTKVQNGLSRWATTRVGDVSFDDSWWKHSDWWTWRIVVATLFFCAGLALCFPLTSTEVARKLTEPTKVRST